MITRRNVLVGTTAAMALMALSSKGMAAGAIGPQVGDYVLVCNEDSQTLSIIDPVTDTVVKSINLTSFDEDRRPPFRFVTGGIIPTHAAMTGKALYHGAINIHGGAPSPDQRLSAVTGRGSSNIYLIDYKDLSIVGNAANPLASSETTAERLTSGVLVGREPHEPTFSRNGKEIWVALRGEGRIAIVDVELAKEESAGKPVRAVREYVETIHGPAQTWFSKDGTLAYVISQKTAEIDVFHTNVGNDGFSAPKRIKTIDISDQDPFAFTPFQKVSPDGAEMWMSHKIADHLSVREIGENYDLLDYISLGEKARPNHVEFAENDKGRVVYASLGRIDDEGPGGVASSQIAIIDRNAPAGERKVVSMFFSHGRESHGVWTDPDATKLYVAHEQDELPGTPNEGQTITSVFDITDPLKPVFVKQIPLGFLDLPSGQLRNKKSINLIYVRPGAQMHTG
ncbi:beta-propeller fold lactonase family protein [Sulfitobacter sp. 20_GPM-1509m]|uniref:beta-propeller fold lactonase family protein n=1 Tax=Sulfitobacter sp. 20_GPM-1509m TaxID=1380367 RepID=UPI000562E058|nr:beta-propeller fold lactonase family protein [Sulfitobacter sp. 20_GPM-1509m]